MPKSSNTWEKSILLRLLKEKAKRIQHNKLASYYPATGPLRRSAYPRHLEFFRAGKQYRERLMLAANRVGKTEGVGGFEMTLHLTGRYPSWWPGRRFNHPIRAVAASDTAQTTRDILQHKLLGPLHAPGTGLIPAKDIQDLKRKTTAPNAVEFLSISHSSGGRSLLNFRSYDQKRKAFQGTEQDVIWLDEEPPLDVYTECLMRTMTTNGLLLLTFTPLSGLSQVVLTFLPTGKLPDNRAHAAAHSQSQGE